MGRVARGRHGDRHLPGRRCWRAEADAEGAVHDPTPLTPGAYTVIVTAVGYAPAASSAIVTASGRAEIGNVTLARQGGNELPPPGPWTVDPAHSSVGAVAQHLGISSVHGRFTDFSATIEIAPDDVSKSPRRGRDHRGLDRHRPACATAT